MVGLYFPQCNTRLGGKVLSLMRLIQITTTAVLSHSFIQCTQLSLCSIIAHNCLSASPQAHNYWKCQHPARQALPFKGSESDCSLLLPLIHFGQSYLLLPLRCSATVTLCSNLTRTLYYCSPQGPWEELFNAPLQISNGKACLPILTMLLSHSKQKILQNLPWNQW